MVRLLIMVNGKMGLQGKRQSIFENVQNQIFEIFKMLKNRMKFTTAVYWVNWKISNRGTSNTLSYIILSLLLVIVML